MRSVSPKRLLLFGVPAGLLLGGCPSEVAPVADELADDPVAYIEDAPYRRGILLRDLTSLDNQYASERVQSYGIAEEGWDALPAVDWPSRALNRDDIARLQADEPLLAGEVRSLRPEALPEGSGWEELGRRVFFEYPLRPDPTYRALASLGEEALEETGFLWDGDEVVGLRVFVDGAGEVQVGNSCAQCHASYEGRAEPQLDGVLSNRRMDVGAARLRTLGFEPGALPPELESTSLADLDKLGPGRTDVLPDGEFNPYAFPDFGGIGSMPFLHHNANWWNRQTATLAVRCETLFITSSARQSRIPRVLSWALARWQRALPPPEPLEGPSERSEEGEQVFADAGCDGCHAPPLYTSDREVAVAEVGTDSAAGLSPVRRSGNYRVPSLRGVGRAAPYLHHGAAPSLEALFDPEREEPGHPFGLELGAQDREALLAFLRTL